jgi:hypothetical protein
MINPLNYPVLLSLLAFASMWLASAAGLWLRGRLAGERPRSDDLDLVTGATLSLLALIIGFTFSMAGSRYDQRKINEESEANAIGTEYLRAELLPPPDAARVRALLRAYLDERIKFFESGDPGQEAAINQRTDQLELNLWEGVRAPASAQPTPVTALAVGGMNNVIDARGFSQAAIWNRIPPASWILLGGIALLNGGLLGYGSRDSRRWRRLGFVLPVAVGISFLLIADIDAPRHGLIRVNPENLQSLAHSLVR